MHIVECEIKSARMTSNSEASSLNVMACKITKSCIPKIVITELGALSLRSLGSCEYIAGGWEGHLALQSTTVDPRNIFGPEQMGPLDLFPVIVRSLTDK